MAFTLPTLPYAYNALEPAIDAKTMEIHHTKHHQAYITKLNAAIEGTAHASKTIEQIVTVAKPEDLAGPVRNNGGGHINHALFWSLLKPGGSTLGGEIKSAIETDLGGFDAFKKSFADAGANRFGSGWAWLCVKNGKLHVTSTPNQDHPFMFGSEMGTPVLALDVWEHAYYLNYQNRRPDYIEAFFGIINWDKVNELYTSAK